ARYHAPTDAGPERLACASCHAIEGGADHSPLVAALFTDAELTSVIMTGLFPAGMVLDIEHTWALTESERAGVAPYLRSLAPRGFAP
nr:hypothetical protein [Deltaproteobacteria bacterium]